MLDFLWLKGTITVARRSGGQKLWDLTERCLAQWIGNESLSSEEVVYRAAQKSLRALGVGRENHISKHYIRDRYPKLNETLAQLEREGRILRVQIEEDGKSLSGTWYIHADDVPLLEHLIAGEWEPRTVLLSPFDNLLCDRARTELLFNFNYRIEIYVPAPKRQYGYYVLPILQGDRFIGRLDATMNRKQKKLFVNAVYAEADAPITAGKSVRGEIEAMAAWLGAKDIEYTERIPERWRKALNGSTPR
jgi:uncharacterized protein YcaQ